MAAAQVTKDGASEEVHDPKYMLEKQPLHLMWVLEMRTREEGIKNN